MLLIAAFVVSTCEPASERGSTPEPSPPLSGQSVDVDPEELTKDEHGEVASNSHTARWRIFTDNGRDMFAKARF